MSTLRIYRGVVICLLVYILGQSYIYAQESEGNLLVHESEFYRVRSEVDLSHATNTAENLELLLEHFAEGIRFDPNQLSEKLQVRIFSNRNNYAEYLSGTTFVYGPPQDFIYFHNSDPSRAELVGVVENTNTIDPSFVHQAFIQYLRAFINHPPLWLREGLAIYYEQTSITNGDINIIENLSWLEEAKRIILGNNSYRLTLNQILLMDTDTAQNEIQLFYPQSWALVYFLLNSDDRSYNRLLWDSLLLLDSGIDLVTNSTTIYNAIFRWIQPGTLNSSLFAFLQETRTYAELIEEAVNEYEMGNLDSVEANMRTAVSRQDDSPLPHYYLGLVEYDRMNYALAEFHYLNAISRLNTISREQEGPIVYYALGLNSFASNQYSNASEYLQTARELDISNNHTDKIAQIEERIGELQINTTDTLNNNPPESN